MNTGHLTMPFKYFYTYKIGGQVYKSDETDIQIETLNVNEFDMNTHIARYNTVELMRKIINYRSTNSDHETLSCYNQMELYYTSKSDLNDPLSLNILVNIQDQIKLASTDAAFFKRWGEFYLDQLSRALNQQLKPNFKDQACMSFGGEIFDDIVDKASDVFDSLPPPEPSLINRQVQTPTYRGLGTAPPVIVPRRAVTLAAYNNEGAGCFVGESIVSMMDGKKKVIKNLVKGDRVCTLSDVYDTGSPIVEATVVCVLQTNIISGSCKITTLPNGLKVTPWHPINVQKRWIFPTDMYKTTNEECSAVYTIILDSFHTFMINDVWAITLGHGYYQNITLNHVYWGTTAVTNDLKKFPGWKNGRVVIDNNYIIRDDLSKEVIAIRYFHDLQTNSYRLFG